MTRFPARLVSALSIVACVSLLTAAGAVASDRVPVRSVDDAGLSIVNRIGAVDNVVVAMDARIDRITGSLPAGHPPSPIFESLTATQASLHTLIATIDTRLCSQDATYGSGDASLADADVFAEDRTTTGLTNQLGSVRTVLAEATGRLIRVIGSIPAGPPVRELDDALTAVRQGAAAGFDAIAVRIGGDIHPPSPCHSS
jgi:hypothetical protein